MPAKRPLRPSKDGVGKRLARLETQLRRLTDARVDVRREEHDEVLIALKQLEQHTHDLDIQFKRIAQIQADLDDIKRAWQKMNMPS